ncbi:5195_t:CDS:2, partial [Acaulospora morrowiae]
MSREHHDNQPIGTDYTNEEPLDHRASVSSVKSGQEGHQSNSASRVSVANVPSSHARSRPTSSNVSTRGNSPPPRLTRRKSSFVVSENETPEDSDEDTDNSRRKIRRRPTRTRSHRNRRQSATPSESMDDNERESHRSSRREEDDANQDDIVYSGSDREFTLKDRQDVSVLNSSSDSCRIKRFIQFITSENFVKGLDFTLLHIAINITHPFGLPLWKPALYKKSRSVIRDANSALHSIPSSELYLYPGNIVWAILFGWWLALISYILSIFLLLTPSGGWQYSRVLRELSYYIFWPFGKYVERMEDDWDGEDEEQGELHVGDHDLHIDEDRPLLGRRTSYGNVRRMKRENHDLFCGLSEIGPAGFVFYFWFFLVI